MNDLNDNLPLILFIPDTTLQLAAMEQPSDDTMEETTTVNPTFHDASTATESRDINGDTPEPAVDEVSQNIEGNDRNHSDDNEEVEASDDHDSEEENHELFNMEMWAQRCSICFDNQYDFCLGNCRDQFCRRCFSKYVEGLVRNSWGMLAQTQIKCPVCSDSLDKQEWIKYVTPEVVLLYDRYNQPFKTFSRCCPQCNHECSVTKQHKSLTGDVNDGSSDDESARSVIGRERVFERVNELLVELLGTSDRPFLADYQSMYKRHLYGTSEDVDQDEEHEHDLEKTSITDIYTRVLDRIVKGTYVEMLMKPVLMKRRRASSPTGGPSLPSFHSMNESSGGKNNSSEKAQSPLPSASLLRSRISSLLISLESSPKAFRELQFQHLHHFRNSQCENCAVKFCFQCGLRGWHAGRTCVEWMKQIIRVGRDRLAMLAANNADQGNEIMTRSRFQALQLQQQQQQQEKQVAATSHQRGSDIEQMFDEEFLSNLQWKVDNSKCCPRCCTLINREEGCNKVDCSMCGNRFCWVCLSAWGEKCGFYKCGKESTSGLSALRTPTSPSVPVALTVQTHLPELGVPDIDQIHSRLVSPVSAHIPNNPNLQV